MIIIVIMVYIILKISSRTAIHAGKAFLSSNALIKSVMRTGIASGLGNACEIIIMRPFADRVTPLDLMPKQTALLKHFMGNL